MQENKVRGAGKRRGHAASVQIVQILVNSYVSAIGVSPFMGTLPSVARSNCRSNGHFRRQYRQSIAKTACGQDFAQDEAVTALRASRYLRTFACSEQEIDRRITRRNEMLGLGLVGTIIVIVLLVWIVRRV